MYLSVLLGFNLLLTLLLMQTSNGNIVGTVMDQDRAVVPAAPVVVRNEQTGIERKTATNERGDYAVRELHPGDYEVQIAHTSFSPATFAHVHVNVDETVRLDAILKVAPQTLDIPVVAPFSLLKTETSEIGHIVDRKKITELPLNERNFLNFTLLVPGAQMPSQNSQLSAEGAGGAISVNGAREQSNNFLLDGMDNNFLENNQYALLPSIDAIEEFKVQSSNASAEFGRQAGAQINVLIKSGTNAFHGSLFEFLRNRKLDAKNFFDPPDCVGGSQMTVRCAEIPRLDRNQFGGTLGGPLKQRRTFFFASYEGLRLRQATTRQATVPSQVQREVVLRDVPPTGRNRAGEAALSLYPAANSGSDLRNSNTFTASPVVRNETDQFLLKVDHHLSNRDSFAGHYGITDSKRFDPFALLLPFTNLPGFGTNRQTRGQSALLSWQRVSSRQWLNEVRVAFNRRREGSFQQSAGIDKSGELGFQTVSPRAVDWGFPNITVAGFDGIGESIVLPQDQIGNTFQISDNFSSNPRWQNGSHQLKFGVDVRRFQWNSFLDVFSRGNWFFLGVVTGNPLEDLLRGVPTFALASSGDTVGEYRTTAFNAYGQDDIRFSSRLTINIGIRYEFNSPVNEKRNRLSIPVLSSASVSCTPKPDCQFLRVGLDGRRRSTYKPDRNNFAPRIGFAWRPSNRSVIRSAYGIFFDASFINRDIFPRLNPPFFNIGVFPNLGSGTIQNILGQPSVPTPPQVGMVDPKYRDAYLQEWNLDFQQEIGQRLILDIAYVGSKGTKLSRQIDFSQPRPGGLPPYPEFGATRYITSGASSSYHSLQLKAEQRFTGSTSLLSAYTWSKSIDNSSAMFPVGSEPAIPQDSFDARSERGLSNFHTAHRLVVSYQQLLPFGPNRRYLHSGGILSQIVGNWQVGAITTIQSGHPFTVNRAIDQSLTGTDLDFSDRPDEVSDPFRAGPVPANPNPACHLTRSQGGLAADLVKDPASWFNPCAFAAPATARFGNAGRNSVLGPSLKNLDLSLLKAIPFSGENHRLQLRLEFFNVFNHPNFDLPNRIFDSPTFSVVQSANSTGTKPPRQIQLGLRYVF